MQRRYSSKIQGGRTAQRYFVNTTFYRFLYLLICLLGAVADPTKEVYTKATIDFLISYLLIYGLTKYKK